MLRKTVLVRALAFAFSGAALTMAVVPSAMAQSNSTGVIYGHVDAPAGTSITMTNTDTGLKRTVTVDASGSYRATSLPVGHYKVELTRNGTVAGANEVDVVLGQGVEASFAKVAAVQITGRRTRIDVSNANNGAVFSAKELAKLPVQPSLASIALLAPNTTKGDSAFGNTASFGGSGVSENSFYLNGFPITNPLSQLGSMELPFGAIQQASVMTGGFGAEFGRSIGGVMSVTTKSGTNNWEAGATYSTQPNSLRSKQHNIYYAQTGDADLDGTMDRRRDNRSLATNQYGGYVGGPIIADKLFMFVSADQTVTKDGYVGATTQTNAKTIAESGWNQNRTLENRWVAKFDWNISDNHRLEFTSAGDDNRTRYQKYGYVLKDSGARATLDGAPNNTLYTSATAHNVGPTDPEFPGAQGASVNMLKYTGNINDDLTVTALYGEMTTKRGVSYEQVGAYQSSSLPPTVSTGVGSADPTKSDHWTQLDESLYRNHNPFPGYISTPGQDKVKSARLDLEWKLGKHTVRAGIDEAHLSSSTAGQIVSGDYRWIYRHVEDPNSEQSVSYSRPAILANYGGSGAAGKYVSKLIFNSVTSASSKQSAQYIEDRFQLTDKLLLTFGLRNDAYSNSNGDGEKFIEMKHQIAPRFQAAWDVNGDATFKVFGSAGRYYLQLPTQVAARAASRSTYTQQDFTYTGIDPATGAPTGLNQINAPLSADGEYGQAKNPKSVVAQGLKPNYQDELTLGFEKALTANYNFGAKATYRKLGAGIDDSCDLRPMYDYALKNGIDVQNPFAMNCFIYNPGRDVTVWIDGNDADGNPVTTGKGQMAHFTAAQIGEPEAKRTYAALDMFLEHPLRNGWFGRVNYTLSRNSGNMEGQTRSDTGQTDVGTSAAWDFPEFAPGSDGLLPNDRKHQLKMFGFYQLTPEWSIGGNALIQSGRPRLCLGTNEAADGGTDPAYPFGSTYWSPGYGAEYYHCDGKASPRGSMGRLPWEKRLDLNLTYTPAMVKGLVVKLDVFNALNSQTPLSQDPTFDYYGTPEPTYNQYTGYQSPRSAKFTVEYNHKF